jgi:hypothetical protein
VSQLCRILALVITPFTVALGQWTLGSPFADFSAGGLLERSGGAVSVRQRVFSPATNGFRALATFDYDHRAAPGGSLDLAGSSGSIAYRNGATGGWLGLRAERGLTSSVRAGAWRQLADWLNISISSSLRRSSVGGRPSRSWIQSYFDSTYTDTGGWKHWQFDSTRNDPGVAGRKLSWLETEARVGGRVGRLALDGVVGWRPALDSIQSASWLRSTATLALARNVALTVAAGTAIQARPFVQRSGRYAQIGVLLAPAALVHPNETPEITPSASSFRVERAREGEYLVRVRLPRARVVELSGDFNAWKPIRLQQELDGTWTVALALKPGAYRMNLRVDGEAWLPPPGTSSVDDEFNGRVGLVVVR